MTYLNNAATSWPKPPAVAEAMTACLHQAPPSAYRSTGGIADTTSSLLRQRLAQVLGVSHADRIVLCSGATEALNRLIRGLPLTGKPVFVTATEHNSVLRPLWNHPQLRGQTHVVDCDRHGSIMLSALHSALKKNPPTDTSEEYRGLLVFNHCSNVTGQIQDAQAICQLAHDYGLIVIADVSQSAGCCCVDGDSWDCDGLVFTGHKALLGPQGIGGYYLRPGIPLMPLLYGGTGRDSSKLLYTADNFEYEVGTPNTPGMAGLLAGVNHVLEMDVRTIENQLHTMACALADLLASIEGVTVYSSGDSHQGPVVSFNINALTASDAGYILANVYDITLRSGLHCSPLIHPYLGTGRDGTLRASLSVMNTTDDLSALADAVQEICKNGTPNC